jgi:hypothetical protein
MNRKEAVYVLSDAGAHHSVRWYWSMSAALGEYNIANTHSSSSSSSTVSDVPFVLFACVSSVSLDTLEDLKRVNVITSAEEGNEGTMKDLACIPLDEDDLDDFHAKSENTTTSGLSPDVLAITMRAMRSKDEYFCIQYQFKSPASTPPDGSSSVNERDLRSSSTCALLPKPVHSSSESE